MIPIKRKNLNHYVYCTDQVSRMNRDILLCGSHGILENRYFASHCNIYFLSLAATVDKTYRLCETNDC